MCAGSPNKYVAKARDTMSTLIINKQSISVKLEANHLVLHEHAEGGSFQRVPLVDIDRVIIVGQPAITFPVLAKLMDMGIPCSFLTRGGKWRGLMDGDGGFHAERRIAQYEYVGNEEKACQLARRLVMAKIANSRRTLQRLATERSVNLNTFDSWGYLKMLLSQVSVSKTLATLRGVEGMAASCYFRILSEFFPKDMPFPSRTRRPPRDAANALLSFTYVLLANVFVSTVRSHGLDVSCGFFHRGGDRSPALALDLMEPFRPALADRFVLDLINHRRIRLLDHFEGSYEEGVRLNENGRKVVLVAFDELMRRRIKVDNRHLTMRQVAEQEVCSYIKTIDGEESMRFYRAA